MNPNNVRFSTPRKDTDINTFLNKQEVRTVQKNWKKYAKRLNNLGDYNYSNRIISLKIVLNKFDNMIKALTVGRDHAFLDDVLRWPR